MYLYINIISIILAYQCLTICSHETDVSYETYTTEETGKLSFINIYLSFTIYTSQFVQSNDDFRSLNHLYKLYL